VGHSQFCRAPLPGQPPRSGRWHPCCRRCLLKDCEAWFLARYAQARYCSPDCRKAARRWRRWLACQRYRASANGKQHRRDQALRYRGRVRQRSSPHAPESTAPQSDPTPAVAEPGPTPEPPIPFSASCVGQRPAEFLQNSYGVPCHRPGCYVLFLPAVSSLEQKFCSGLCRQALRRVRQREARLRRRRRRGVRPLRYPDRDPPQAAAFMSSPY
jgi:hypothetical protein